MQARLVFLLRVVLVPFITIKFASRATASSIFDLSSNDDLFNSDVDLPLVSDTLPLDQSALLFNDQTAVSLPDVAAADVPLNFDIASSIGENPSQSLFQKPYDSGNDDLFSSESIAPLTPGFEVANGDCSAQSQSEWTLRTIGKSRVRRSGTLGCPDPALPPRDKVIETLQNSEALRLFSGRRSSEDENTACWLVTQGILPWGVCSSGKRKDVTPINMDLMQGGEAWRDFVVVRLQSVTIGMFIHQDSFL